MNMPTGKQRLIESAFTLFSAQGFDQTSSRDVAERAGVSLGLIHKHFGGMNGLLDATDEHCLTVTTKLLDLQLAAILLDDEISVKDDNKIDREATVYLMRALSGTRRGSDKLFAATLDRYVSVLRALQNDRGLKLSQPVEDCGYFLLAMDTGFFALIPLSEPESVDIKVHTTLVRNALLQSS